MIKVDALGDQCPIPVVKTKKALEKLTEGGKVETHVDNEIAVQNLSKMAKQKGISYTSEKIGDRHFIVTMEVLVSDKEKAAGINGTANNQIAEEAALKSEGWACIPDARGDFVVAIGSATMGDGNDALGKVLMKSFIYAVSQLDKLPKTILFYNGGVTLTTEGSDSIEDLKNMEAQGVEIMSCGTCLNYYEREDKLLVGDVTNMYDIVETLAGAGKIIKP
ncbi:MAG: sulfurtransferase-like selenium metabolism protein YedF [Lachnospiraceae bacterium]|nr:sulfurtransferase-like selenium metabolism protein YedF [Lachnospiraceae bacterium]